MTEPQGPRRGPSLSRSQAGATLPAQGKAAVQDADIDSAAMAARQAWMAVLARASAAELAAVLEGVGPVPAYDRLRGPEIGAIMVEGRAGGTGTRFNLGEATVTRCTVRLAGGPAGHCTALGRDPAKAEAAAVIDALLQRDPALQDRLIAPLAAGQAAARAVRSRKAAATQVRFFTLARGD